MCKGEIEKQERKKEIEKDKMCKRVNGDWEKKKERKETQEDKSSRLKIGKLESDPFFAQT